MRNNIEKIPINREKTPKNGAGIAIYENPDPENLSFQRVRVGGGRWIRFSAEKPRRLRQSTGLSPRAAFRIHLHKFPNTEKRAIHADVASFWWGKVDSKTIRNVAYGIYCGIKSISSR